MSKSPFESLRDGQVSVHCRRRCHICGGNYDWLSPRKGIVDPPPSLQYAEWLLNYNTYDVARLTVGSQLTEKLLKNNIPTLESNTVRCACSLESIRHFHNDNYALYYIINPIFWFIYIIFN